MSEWQPIETAPKGEVILYFPTITGRNAKAEWITVGFADAFPFRQPTHWMPLPAPPSGG